jgi:hypothetical protein
VMNHFKAMFIVILAAQVLTGCKVNKRIADVKISEINWFISDLG